jgi:hypothetical protein
VSCLHGGVTDAAVQKGCLVNGGPVNYTTSSAKSYLTVA